MRKRYMLALLSGILFLTGCASGNTALKNTTEEQAALDEETDGQGGEGEAEAGGSSLPRSLSAYLLPELSWEMGGELEPADFFDLEALEKDLQIGKKDLASLSFETEPDEEMLHTAGEYKVSILAGDMVLNANLKVQDTTPPVITAPEPAEYAIGDTIFYRKGLSVEDNSGETPEILIDSSGVYANMAGTYQVIYSAVDSSGNKATAESAVTILEGHEADEEEVAALAEELLKSILTDGMTKLKQAEAIYDWCHDNIMNSPNADKTDRIQAVYDGLYYRMGDCYTYFATSSYLLTACGIDNLDVSQKRETATHYWSLVNTGDGWYHFDSSQNIGGFRCFMQTDAQVRAYGEEYRENGDFYVFDETDMPQRAKEILFENS